MTDDSITELLASYHRVLTPEEVGELLRVHKQVIYRWLQQGTLPGHKLGKNWRIVKDDLADWLRQNRNNGAIDGDEAGDSEGKD